ncbi:hypothetical protein LUZ60_010780 [Juncus effusus]|nr:hypothetical protein LUZ60_010780 [Juncus effusus]
METAAIMASIGFLIRTVIPQILGIALKRWASLVGLGDEIEGLEYQLTKIQALLDSSNRAQIPNESLMRLLGKLKELAYDADDLLDELDYFRLQDEADGAHVYYDQVSPSTSKLRILRHDIVSTVKRNRLFGTSTPKLWFDRKDISRRIKSVMKQLEKTSDVLDSLKLEKLDNIVNTIRSATTNTRNTTSYITEPKVFGRVQERNHIVDVLTSDGYSGHDVFVVSIVGHGGVGKTTLAKLAYNELAIKQHFHVLIWVCVSTNFDVAKVTCEMLDHITRERHDKTTSLNKLQDVLKTHLMNKKFLLVVDDLWEDMDESRWNLLLAPLRCTKMKGNKVLVTTRSQSVAATIGGEEIIKLEGMADAEFWPFFKACAFGDENYSSHVSLQAIGWQIAQKLKGYPLAVKTVGPLLKKDLSFEHWMRILESHEWKSEKNKDSLIPALKLSYEHLPFHLQRCFSYCSLFQKDQNFRKKELIRLWFAQGFIDTKEGSIRMEDIGDEYFNDLTDLGFFQKALHDEKHYTMHDLIHDLAQIVSHNECLMIDGSESREVLPTVRHLSIYTGYFYKKGKIHGNLLKELHKVKQCIRVNNLRTLILIGEYDSCFSEYFISTLKDAKRLRVLILSKIYHGMDSLFAKFTNYVHLRFLRINSSEISLPKDAHRLYHLQVLHRPYWGNGDFELLEGMDNLLNLRYYNNGKMSDWEVPRVSRLISLQKLKKFQVKNDKGFNIAQLGALRELGGSLKICNLENVKNKEESSAAMLVEKKRLKSLWLSWDNKRSDVMRISDADVLEGLRPPSTLRHLRILGYGCASTPRWFSSTFLEFLEFLYLQDCESWVELPPLGQLPNLKELYLVRLLSVREFGHKFYGSNQGISFRSLEIMSVYHMPKLIKWVGTIISHVFPRLQSLTISDCPVLRDFSLLHSDESKGGNNKSIFPCLSRLTMRWCEILATNILPLPHTPNLNEINIWKVGPIERLELCQKMYPPKLSINYPCLKTLDEKVLIFSNLRNIKSLNIRECRDLRHFSWEGLSQLTSLESLDLFQCSSLLLSFSESTLCDREDLILLPSLKFLSFTNCDVNLEQLYWFLLHIPSVSNMGIVDDHLGINDSNFCVQSSDDGNREHIWLKQLEIYRCHRLLSSLALYPHIALERLIITECNSSVSEEVIHILTRIKFLEVYKCPSFIAALNTASQRLERNGILLEPSLKELKVDSTAFLTIPLCKQLISLQYLEVCGLRREAVEEVVDLTIEQEKALTFLISLKHLKFYGCPNLQQLPTVLSLLDSMKKLDIYHCPHIRSLPEMGFPSSKIETTIQNWL